MAYPRITLTSANALFQIVGIEIKEHFLGYYHCNVNGNEYSAPRLSDLTDQLMTTYFNVPEQRQSPDAPAAEVEPGYDEWQYQSEKRHTDARIL